MRWIILLAMLTWTAAGCRRIRFWRGLGQHRRAMKVFRRHAWGLGLVILLAMAVQEAALLCGGLLTWATGLPLHLCSLMGLLALPMLLGRSRVLRAAALLAGVPGAALAIIFPSIVPSPWPLATVVSFHALHAGLICAPMLPIATGWRARPGDALLAWGFLLFAAVTAMAANCLTGGNYLFLASPVPGTPLMAMATLGLTVYRLTLAGIAAAVLALEGIIIHGIRKRSVR